MDGYQRRKNIFKEELVRDIPYLKELIDKSQYQNIRSFAHKYKMRLSYFSFEEAFKLCGEMEELHNNENLAELIVKANKFLNCLKKISENLNNESISS